MTEPLEADAAEALRASLEAKFAAVRFRERAVPEHATLGVEFYAASTVFVATLHFGQRRREWSVCVSHLRWIRTEEQSPHFSDDELQAKFDKAIAHLARVVIDYDIDNPYRPFRPAKR